MREIIRALSYFLTDSSVVNFDGEVLANEILVQITFFHVGALALPPFLQNVPVVEK